MQQTRADAAVGMADTTVLNTPMPEDMFFLLKRCHNKVIYLLLPKPMLLRPDSTLVLAAFLAPSTVLAATALTVALGAGLDLMPPGGFAPLTPFCQSSKPYFY